MVKINHFIDIFNGHSVVVVFDVFIKNPNNIYSVAEIVKITKLHRITVSCHISKMNNKGLVNEMKRAVQMRSYRLNVDDERVKSLIKFYKEVNE